MDKDIRTAVRTGISVLPYGQGYQYCRKDGDISTAVWTGISVLPKNGDIRTAVRMGI